ncbi:unnamed protein product, partial [Prorocentrum cordatum]
HFGSSRVRSLCRLNSPRPARLVPARRGVRGARESQARAAPRPAGGRPRDGRAGPRRRGGGGGRGAARRQPSPAARRGRGPPAWERAGPGPAAVFLPRTILQRRGSELPELTAVSVDGSPLATGDDSVAKSPSCLGCGRTERRDSLTMIPSCLKSRRASVEDSGIRPPRVRKTGSMPVGLTSPEKDSCASPAGLPCLRRAKTISGDEQERGLRRKPRGSRVCFPSCFLSSTHDVTPYAEKYGVHPRFFEFDRQGNKRLTDSGIMEDIRRAEKCLSPLKLSRQLGPLTQVCKH